MTLNILCVVGRNKIRDNWHKLLQIPFKILHLVLTKVELSSGQHRPYLLCQTSPKNTVAEKLLFSGHHWQDVTQFCDAQADCFCLSDFFLWFWTSLPNCTHFICEERFIMEHNFERLTLMLVHGPCRSDSKKFILAVCSCQRITEKLITQAI